MKFNTMKLALGLVAGLSAALPMVASAAADQEAAIANANNWAHPRGNQSNSGYSALAQVNKGNVKNLKLHGHSQRVSTVDMKVHHW